MSKSTLQVPVNAFLESPLHGFGLKPDVGAIDSGDGVLFSELAHLGHIVLRGNSADAAFTAGVTRVLGLPLPARPMSVLSCDAGVLLWVSPDEWLLVCRRAARDGLVRVLVAALAGVHAQVVDNSGGLATVRLAGREHVRVLRHLGPYDFERLAVGQCVSTVMSKTAITVVRTDPAGVLLIFRRSFADYAWRLLERAARPYGMRVTHPRACADPLFTPLLQLA